MSQSCVVKPCVKNSKGEIVESKLFQDLLSHMPSRAEAVKYYNLARNDEFLARVGDTVTFDENGEITIESLIKEAHISIDSSKIKESLQKEVGKNKMPFNEAIGKVVSFNKSRSFGQSYMATLEESDGQFYVKIVDNTEDNLEQLKSTIEGQELKNRLIHRLAEAGVDVSFIDKNHSRYSTLNAKRNINGLYQLIEFYKHGTTPELAEETGHFILGAMSGNPLVDRLLSLMSPEIMKDTLGDEWGSRNLGENPKKEVAGILVGRALETDIEARSPIDKLIARIINGAKKIIAKISGDQLKLDKLEAEQLAMQLAEGFVQGKLDNSVEQALKEQETFYHREYDAQVKCLNQIKGHLASAARDLRNLDKDIADLIDTWITAIESSSQGIEEATGMFSQSMAALSIAQAMKLISDFVTSEEFSSLVVDVKGLDKEEFLQRLPENAAKLRIYGKFIQYCKEITSAGWDIWEQSPDLFHEAIDRTLAIPEHLNYYNNLKAISDIVNNEETVRNYYRGERLLFAKICEQFYGAKYVNRATRMLWGNKKFEATNPEQFELEEAITHMFADDSIVSSFLGTMSNSNSLAAQIIDKVLKQANFEAQTETGKLYGKLREWEDRWVTNLKLNQRHLFEVDADGSLTGNLLDFTYVKPGAGLLFSSKPTVIDWHTYEEDYEQQMAEWKKQFIESHQEYLTKPDYLINLAFAQWVKKAKDAWHRVHSKWDDARNCYIPNVEYVDPSNLFGGQRYVNTRQSLTKGQADALSEYYVIKQKLDELTGSVMPRHRAPQMRGSFVNTIGNYHFEGSSGIRSLGKAIKDKVNEAFFLIPSEVDAKAAGMWNTRQDDWNRILNPNAPKKENAVLETSDKTRSIPLFGIHKIEDTSRLSTDLVHSTLAYGAMAYNYSAMSNVANALEIGMDYIENRSVEATEPKWWSGKALYKRITGREHRPYIGRMRNYLDRYLYGIGLPRWMFKNVCISKLLPALSRLASMTYLAGNVAGGVINFGTGTIEMFKEGFANEFFGTKDLLRAQGTILASALGIAKDAATAEDSSKVNLFIRHFDLFSDNDKFFAGRYSRGTRILNNWKEFGLMAPYKMGEYMMQAIPYIAMARRTTLYDINGKTTNLWDAYTIAEDKVNLKLNGHFFESKDNVLKYQRFAPLADIVNSSISTQMAWSKIENNPEWVEFFEKKGLGKISKLEVLKRAVKNELEALEFNEDNESAFNDKAREVTNRMHGVYNKMDKTMAHRDLIGSMFMTMKGYALGLIQRRLGGISQISKSETIQKNLGYSVALRGETEGTLTTMFKMAMNQRSWSDCRFFFQALLAPWMPGFETAAQKRGYSVTQAKNAKRNFGDIFAICILHLLNMMTSPTGTDDDDDELLAGHIYYLSMRLYQEQAAYNLPGSFLNEATSLFDAVPCGFSILRDFWTLGQLGWGDIMYDYRKNEKDPDIRKYFYQKSIPGKALKGDAKWKAKVINMTPYVRSLYWAEHPYAAAENYKYVRESKK